MGFIKKIVVSGLVAVVIVAGLTVVAYFTFYSSFKDFQTDLNIGKRAIRLALFNKGLIPEITDSDVRYIYQKRCYRQCHGDAAMITAVLSPSGWFQVVERMRVKENVKIPDREVDIIIRYLEETYPTTKSAYSYEVRKKTHHAVWRNDMGQNDIYCDVIYATPEYLSSIGAEGLISEYDVKNYHVFIVSFSVHEGEVEVMNLDQISFMRSDGREVATTPPWNLRFQTADKHHFEAVIRFAKKKNPVINKNTKWFELVIKGVGGPTDRVYRWNLPIVYPEQISVTINNQ